MQKKKTAVMYGAGNIGRGFIGQVLHDSGYEVAFVDVDQNLIDAFNQTGSYVITVVEGDRAEEKVIGDVRGVNGMDLDAVAHEIAEADVMAVSVGMRILPRIAGNLAAGIRLREKLHPGLPLNLLICENLPDPEGFVRKLLLEALGEDQALLENVGLVAATIGRMIPPLPPEKRRVCTDIHVGPSAVFRLMQMHSAEKSPPCAIWSPIPRLRSVKKKSSIFTTWDMRSVLISAR